VYLEWHGVAPIDRRFRTCKAATQWLCRPRNHPQVHQDAPRLNSQVLLPGLLEFGRVRILASDEVRQVEREAFTRPDVSAALLMQRAGYAVAQFCISQFKFRSVCVICGKGSGGGTGLVASEALRSVAAEIFVIVLAQSAEELSPDLASLFPHLRSEPLWISAETDFDSEPVQQALGADLIVDAIAGAHLNPPLNIITRKAVQAVNDASGIVVSVDVPCGADPDSARPLHENHGNNDEIIFAQGIITFIAPRPAHVFGELTSGPIAVSELGIMPMLTANSTHLDVITGQEAGIAFPPRTNDAHKREFGHVLVIGGSSGTAGSAALAGLAALRAGAGLVTVACPKSIQATVAGFAPELMTEGLPESSAGSITTEASQHLEGLLAGKDIVVLGPGLPRSLETAKLAREFIKRCPLPLLLSAFPEHLHELKLDSTDSQYRVLVLNAGEAAALLNTSVDGMQEDRAAMAQRIFRETGCCVVLKGWRSVVAGASGETWVNMSGNPALAKAGSGDVLSGIIGAALARHANVPSVPPQAGKQSPQFIHKSIAFMKDVRVAAAVYLHGLSGDIVRDRLHENTALATDLLAALTEAFRNCELQVDQGLFYLQN